MDTVATQVLNDGARNHIVKLTCKSDGTGETGVKKIDVSTLYKDPSEVSIQKIEWDVSGLEVELLWEATPDVSIMKIYPGQDCKDYTGIGGLTNNAPAGGTGNILLTTTNATNGDGYTIILHLKKKYG